MTTDPMGVNNSLPTSTSQISESQNLNDRIKDLSFEIMKLVQQSKDIREEIGAVKEEINALNKARPRPPGSDASKDAKEAYSQAMSSFNGQIDALRGRLQGLNESLEKVMVSIEKTQRKIEKLEGQKGGAQMRDADRMRRELEQESEKLKATVGEATEEVGYDATSGAAEDRQISLRKFERAVSVDSDNLKDIVKVLGLMLMAAPEVSATENKFTGQVRSAGRTLPLSEPGDRNIG